MVLIAENEEGIPGFIRDLKAEFNVNSPRLNQQNNSLSNFDLLISDFTRSDSLTKFAESPTDQTIQMKNNDKSENNLTKGGGNLDELLLEMGGDNFDEEQILLQYLNTNEVEDDIEKLLTFWTEIIQILFYSFFFVDCIVI